MSIADFSKNCTKYNLSFIKKQNKDKSLYTGACVCMSMGKDEGATASHEYQLHGRKMKKDPQQTTHISHVGWDVNRERTLKYIPTISISNRTGNTEQKCPKALALLRKRIQMPIYI